MDQRLLLRGARVTFHGRTKDISESGLGAIVAGELDANQPLELEFYLPGKLNLFKLRRRCATTRVFSMASGSWTSTTSIAT